MSKKKGTTVPLDQFLKPDTKITSWAEDEDFDADCTHPAKACLLVERVPSNQESSNFERTSVFDLLCSARGTSFYETRGSGSSCSNNSRASEESIFRLT